MFQAQQNTQNIRIENQRISFNCLLDNRADFAFRTCVIDCNIEPAKQLDGFFNQIFDVFFVTYIRLDEFRFCPETT